MTLSLRPAGVEDHELLLRIFVAGRGPEFALLAADERVGALVVAQQFQAQDRSWRAAALRPSFDLVLADGVTIGRLVVDRRPDEIRLVDITLLPEHRGRGYGTELMNRLIEESEQTGLALSLHVFWSNPARSLYQRLGFVAVEDSEVYLLLRRAPGQAKTAS